MSEIVFLVEDSPEDGLVARALGYSIFTDGQSYEHLRENARDAVRCHFENGEMPTVIRFDCTVATPRIQSLFQIIGQSK